MEGEVMVVECLKELDIVLEDTDNILGIEDMEDT
jgi:hypothetical protein